MNVIKELARPFESGEYGRLVEIGEENAHKLNVPPGTYLATRTPGEIATRAQLILGPDVKAPIVTRISGTRGKNAQNQNGVFLVKIKRI